jgi:peptidoglycan pentaglycine glycine transferase (the first glycine)
LEKSVIATSGETIPTSGVFALKARNPSEALVVPDSDYKLEFSEEVDDRGWDTFLESTHFGQFQQSSLWGKAKVLQRWNVVRLTIRNGSNEIVGGLQLLWRKKHWLRIGYISKGPVFEQDSGQLIELGPRCITLAAKKYGIHALIVQAPDHARQMASLFSSRPFEENQIISVISSTQTIDLTQGIVRIREGMSRRTRYKSRLAYKRGVSIREGDEADLNAFFQLMLATCARQKEKRPNPETVEQLQLVWRVFHEKNHIRLSLAICEGEIVAGLVLIMFGSRVSSWKKGWSGQYRERHPNELLQTESIEWAVAQGYRCYDFVGLNRNIAEALFHNRELSEEQLRSRDIFNLGFGGKPELLPESRVYVHNSLLAAMYRSVIRSRAEFGRFQTCPR